jgi:DNA polymerase-3 subunit gamma/tau
MSYQVLARKWRPKNFQELIGQEHVVNVLANALSQSRLHHAYLFTGTRGVGKTTIARIFAKSLNCQQGITNTPCGKCDACLDIDQGRFVDLLEIDAASKTKVDDTREILDNVQYAPSRGRFKVYLIDEVHMLSRHSFNALLKTLEEPPEHVKFILATTDPQKLPITVLSRCLQFHLKALTVKQIEHKLAEILAAEKVDHDAGTLTLLAKAARGSMRDSLSLTDQAIAQGQGTISLVNIQQMLGGIDQNWVYQLVIALLKQDSEGLIALLQKIASFAPSYSRLFAELIQLFHHIALYQIIKQNFDLPADLLSLLQKFSSSMSPEDVQLYYQISLNGRKDLPYAHDEQAAFDMTLLRLLAFKPMSKLDITSKQVKIDSTALNSQNAPVINISDEQAPTQTQTQAAPFSKLQPVVSGDNLADTPISKGLNLGQVSDDDKESLLVSATKQVSEQETEKALTNVNSDNHSESTTHSSHSAQVSNSMTETQNVVDNSVQQFSGKSESVISDSVAEQGPLNNEMLAIEQQAALLSHASDDGNSSSAELPTATDNMTNSVQSISGEEFTTPSIAVQQPSANQVEQASTIESPVSSVLATRNMLRSRKKTLETQVKKPHDASLRHSPTRENLASSDTSLLAQSSTAVKVNNQYQAPAVELPDLPEPQTAFNHNDIDPKLISKANQVDKWAHMIDSMQLTARIRQLAIHATISAESTDDHLILQLDKATRHLNTDAAHQQLGLRISEFLSRQVKVSLNIVDETVADPYQIQSQINDKRLEYAKSVIKKDNTVMALQQTFQATIDESSIKPR